MLKTFSRKDYGMTIRGEIPRWFEVNGFNLEMDYFMQGEQWFHHFRAGLRLRCVVCTSSTTRRGVEWTECVNNKACHVSALCGDKSTPVPWMFSYCTWKCLVMHWPPKGDKQ